MWYDTFAVASLQPPHLEPFVVAPPLPKFPTTAIKRAERDLLLLRQESLRLMTVNPVVILVLEVEVTREEGETPLGLR